MNIFGQVNRATNLYKKFEVYISIITFSFGLIATFLTLTRVDMFIENFWIVINLLIVIFAIFIITLYENGAKLKNIEEIKRQNLNFYFTLLMQFAFGGLFSTFFVFYIRSSSLLDSWLFLLILVILLVGNEIWKKHYERLTFQISALFISIYLFLIFLLPVVFHRLGADLFILSGILGLILIFIFTRLLRKFAIERFQDNHRNLKRSIIGIFIIMNIFYFTNIIPPIPLSLKDSGVYHQITKISAGQYLATGEKGSWQDYFKRFPAIHISAGGVVYAYSAIFSPIKFATEIVHQWQYYDETKEEWVNSSKITLPIAGGREEGFRTYSIKQGLAPGFWRVKVQTARGQVLGKINFTVESPITLPDLIEKSL